MPPGAIRNGRGPDYTFFTVSNPLALPPQRGTDSFSRHLRLRQRSG